MQEYPKQSPNLGISVRLKKKTHLQQLSNPPSSLLAFGKNHPHTRKYRHANLEVEGCGKEKNRLEFLMQMYKREIKYKSG